MTAKPVAIVTGGAGFIGSHMVDVLVEHALAGPAAMRRPEPPVAVHVALEEELEVEEV